MKTRKGIYIRTEDSEEYYYVFKNYKVYFSSPFILEKFRNHVQEFIYENNQRIINRYQLTIDLDDYLFFSYYKQVEKRGYKIEFLESGHITNNIDNITFRAWS